VRVIDDTNSTTFVLFDKDTTKVINKSCAELFEYHVKVNFQNLHMSINAYKKRLVYKFIYFYVFLERCLWFNTERIWCFDRQSCVV